MDQIDNIKFITHGQNYECMLCKKTWPKLKDGLPHDCIEPGIKQLSILQEAQKVIDERRKSYGSPKNNLGITKRLWDAWLDGKYLNKGLSGFQIDVQDVAMMQILLKVAREANSSKRDNLVDIAGYAQCYMECLE